MLSAIFLQKAYFIFLPVILICKFVKKVFPDIHNKFFIVQHLIQIFLPEHGIYRFCIAPDNILDFTAMQ